jgi:hypothetical protein
MRAAVVGLGTHRPLAPEALRSYGTVITTLPCLLPDST